MVTILPPSYSSSNVYSRHANSIPDEVFIKLIHENKIYDEVNALYPMSKNTYYALLKKHNFVTDSVRIKERRDKIILDSFNNGESAEEIAQKLNMKISAVKSILNDLGAPINTARPVPEPTIEEIQRVLFNGGNIKKIADKYHMNKKRTLDFINHLGLEIENKKQQKFIIGLDRATIQNWIKKYGSIDKIIENIKIQPETLKKCIELFHLHI